MDTPSLPTRGRATLPLRPDRLDHVPSTTWSATGGFDPVAVAVFAVAVSAAGSARPSLWFDEAATISAGTRTLPELWRLLGNIDAVHGLFYLLAHGWLTLFPATEFWLRLPSCLAVGAAAAGVVVLGRRFASRTVAVSAGVIFAILPRITWAGIEARSYALSTAVAVWLTVLLVAAVRRDRPGWWLAYTAALVGSTVLNLFAVLVVLPHFVAVARCAPGRAGVWRWVGWVVGATAVLMPFALFCRTQIAQVQWISPLSPGTLLEIGYQQYFDRSASFATAAALVLLACLALRRFASLDGNTRTLAAVTVAWMVLPTLALVGYSALAEPIYYPRYLCFTSPAAALFLAICLVALAQTRERVTALLVVLALAAAPNYLLKQRGPYAKEGMDFSQVADLVTARAAPGDCLILDNTVSWLPGPVRPLTAARPAAYAKLIDPGRGALAADRNRLWDAHIPIWAVTARVQRCTVLWTVSDRDGTLPAHEAGPGLSPGPRMNRAPAYQVPARLGFHIVERWQFHFAQVTRSTR